MSTDAATLSHQLLHAYAATPHAFDEIWESPGRIRETWQSTLEHLSELGLSELQRRDRESRRQIRENGVTYNMAGDVGDLARPWSFNVIPQILAPEEWTSLETGLAERAQLLELLLQDLYGPRSLIHDGVLPIEMIESDSAYLRPCWQLNPLGRRHLYLYAADLARRPDGSFVVLDDRTQAPSGFGYALENRIILSRVLSDLYASKPVQRLSLFFSDMLSSLQAFAPDAEPEPRIVLLTPGPRSETYFEHAYLAHYLGVSLVEGSDLVVREQKVWLRTLEGLERVHVIVRRVDESFCDPLELRPDSVLGVPGLLGAIRAGSVIVANPPGAGICENLAVLAFLPDIAQRLLGRNLSLPFARAWWCGRDADRDYVLTHADELLIRDASGRGYIPRLLVHDERQRLFQAISRQPISFAARELLDLATTPILTDAGLEPRGYVLRALLCAAGPSSFSVMPGGLTRVAAHHGVVSVSTQDGGISKDVWVLSLEPPTQFSMLPNLSQQAELRRSSGDLASRVAENLYWVGRYAERTEGTARILRSIILHLLDRRTTDDAHSLPELLSTLTHVTTTYPGFIGDVQKIAHPDAEILALIFDRRRPGTVQHSLDALCRSGRSSRDRLSDEMYRLVNILDDDLEGIGHLGDAVERLHLVVIHVSALAGLVTDSMARGPAFWFVDIGRRIERGLTMIALIRCGFFFDDELSSPLAEVLLDVSDSLMTYRRRYKSRLYPAGVLDLLLTDESNPRSLVFQLLRLDDHLRQEWGKRNQPQLREARLRIRDSLVSIRATDVDTLERQYSDPVVKAILQNKLADIDRFLRQTSDLICAHYFSQVDMPRQLVDFS
jgi:uncharacterized circularly permuted ATP-grasp superfamily protein/uncharacterized alpha-E superfamily protein